MANSKTGKGSVKKTTKKNPSKSNPSKTRINKKTTNLQTTSKKNNKIVKSPKTNHVTKNTKKEVNPKTMEIKVLSLPKQKIENKQEEVSNKLVRIEKKPKRKSNSKKITKSKKQSISKDIEKIIRKIKMYGISSVLPLKSIIIILIMIAIIIFTISLFIGFLGSNDTLNLENIPNDIDQLNTISFNIEDADNIITSSNAYTNLKEYYTYDFETEFNLNPSYIEEFVIRENISKKQVFIAIKPSNEHDQDIKNIFEKYLKEKDITNYEYLPYQDYQFFIASNNNPVVISKIRQSQIRVFDALKELKNEDIYNELGINSNLYEEALVKRAVILSKNTGYYIFKATSKSHAKKINTLMEEYFTEIEEDLLRTNPNEYELVKKRYSKVNGSLCIYIISYDNDLVKDLLKI